MTSTGGQIFGAVAGSNPLSACPYKVTWLTASKGAYTLTLVGTVQLIRDCGHAISVSKVMES